jgi:hypothetical protein
LNINGLKDENEETVSTSNICNGENGASIKAFTTASTTCDNGGIIYSFYGDTNNNDTIPEEKFNLVLKSRKRRSPLNNQIRTRPKLIL